MSDQDLNEFESIQGQSEAHEAPPQPNPISAPSHLQGRAASARNAIRHGVCADQTLILSHEKLEDFQALEAMWFKAYNPQAAAEKHLVQELVMADWLLERANRALMHVEAHMFESGYMATNWSDNQHLKLARFTRYQTARANNVAKCRKAVEDYRKARLSERNNTAKTEITEERLKKVIRQNQPAPFEKEINLAPATIPTVPPPDPDTR